MGAGNLIALSLTIFTLTLIRPHLALKFTVNSFGVEADTKPGDGICRTASNRCTLRAAIEEANARVTRDVIVLRAGTHKSYDSGSNAGLAIRESVLIRGAGATKTFVTGNEKERHFEIRNEKLVLGLRKGEVGANRPSSGKRLRSIAPTGDVDSSPGAFLFTSDAMYTTYFTKGVAKYKLRTRETLEGSANKFPYEFDRIVISTDNGNGAGLTTPTTISQTSDGDLLINSFQPTLFGIRRYDKTTFAYKGIFIAPPGIVNSIVKIGSHLFLTLVSSREIRKYSASDGSFVKSTTSFLNTPRGITECGGRIFVASEDTTSIVEFDEDLKFIQSLTDTRLVEPRGVACSNRELFIRADDSKLWHFRLRAKGTRGFDYVQDLSRNGQFVSGIATIAQRDYIDGPKVNLLDMTLQDGRVTTGSSGPSVSIARGTNVKIVRCIIRDNVGSVFGGAITNSGTAAIQRSRLIDNSGPRSTLSGGGVTNSGGAIGNFGKMSISWSELSGNQAARGGAIWNSGAEGFLKVFQCTISNNYAGNAGGGIYNARFAQVKFSTITENRCGEFFGDPASRRAGCGIYSFRNPSKRRNNFLLSHTILAKNRQLNNMNTYAPDCLAPVNQAVISAGANLIGGIDEDFCKIIGRTSLDRQGARFNEVDPLLGKLSFLRSPVAGGRFKLSSTRGHNPVANGPAHTFNPFTNGQSPSDKCPAKDQVGRKRSVGVTCDIGSIERLEV